MYDALTAGASGFLLKDASAQQLVNAVERTVAGETPMASPVMARLIERFLEPLPPTAPDPPGLRTLSRREREVLGLIAGGLTNVEIADHLVVSMATVKTHVRSILAKLDARDRVQVVILAHRYGVTA